LSIAERPEAINHRIPDKSALSVNTTFLEFQKEVQFKSITSDNGREFAKLGEAMAGPVYYCHVQISHKRDSSI